MIDFVFAVVATQKEKKTQQNVEKDLLGDMYKELVTMWSSITDRQPVCSHSSTLCTGSEYSQNVHS